MNFFVCLLGSYSLLKREGTKNYDIFFLLFLPPNLKCKSFAISFHSRLCNALYIFTFLLWCTFYFFIFLLLLLLFFSLIFYSWVCRFRFRLSRTRSLTVAQNLICVMILVVSLLFSLFFCDINIYIFFLFCFAILCSASYSSLFF